MSAELLLPGTAVDTLTARKSHGQWRLSRLQVVNWGGFQGPHTLDLDAGATMLSGASGTGKSTLLDAWTALMMDSNTPFNGASNSSGGGRARSATQRNVLTYARGLTDLSRDETNGDARADFLRGNDQATWSAIAATFQHEDGTRHTALRMYYAPANATSPNDLTAHMAYTPGDFELLLLEQFAAERFPKKRIKALFPTLVFAERYSHWSSALCLRLGIGQHGDGAPALRLLSRIQAGRTIGSVDALFKELVLETPATYAAADRAVEHFAELDKSKQLMATAQAQVTMLSPLEDLATQLSALQREADLLDTFHVTRTGPSPVGLWLARKEKLLLEGETATAHRRAEEARARLLACTTRAAELEKLLRENEQQQRDRGGDALAGLAADVERLTANQAAVEAARATFRTSAPELQPPGSSEEMEGLHQAAQPFVANWGAKEAAFEAEQRLLWARQIPLEEELKAVRSELAYIAGRKDLIPQPLDAARNSIAVHTGIPAEQLKFAAELIDVPAEHEPWRQAAELLLSGLGRTLLVDKRETEFRARLDTLRLNPRIRFVLADLTLPSRELDDRYLPGRLIFAEGTPFLGWLHSELESTYRYECMDGSAFPADGRRAITRSGQIQNGARGAHGGHGRAPLLGFSNARRLEWLTSEETRLVAALDEVTADNARLERRRSAARNEHRAHTHVLTLRWEQLDAVSAEDALAEAQRRHQELLDTSDQLATLQAQHTELKTEHEQVSEDRGVARNTLGEQEKLWGRLVEEEDEASRRAEELEALGVTLTDEQTSKLEAEYQRFSSTGTADELVRVVTIKLRTSLEGAAKEVGAQAASVRGRIENTLTQYQECWPNPNLGTSATSVDGYLEILEGLLAEGLAARRAEFTKRVIEWSSEDLLGLAGAYREAITEINERLAPVNDNLSRLPFGANLDRLRIQMRERRAADVNAFRTELRQLASATMEIAESDVDARFVKIGSFMSRIQEGSRERDHLLDVRRHVHIEAERHDPRTGAVLSVYDSLGGKSGGEAQELVAFIVGAALRYRLGTDDNSQPAFAPVLLDEAFIKADSEFAGRAVSAWQGLGFQLIVAAPLDKVSALEPHVDRVISVVKQADYSFTHAFAAQRRSAAAEAGRTPSA